jgi:shikimate kinase
MSRENFVLIGMPGCGKSTLGVVAAKLLCMDFLDVDLLLQKRIGMSLQEYIDRFGTESFLEAEADLLSSLDVSSTVISTGGSAVLTERGAMRLKELGVLVYIRVPFEMLEKRLTNLSDRGVARKSGQSLRDIYEERCPIYEKYADITIDIGTEDIASSCERLVACLKDAAD